MKSTLQHTKWIFVALLAVVLASCQPTGVSDKELAATYAAQTLAAMPNKTAAPKETQMPEAASTATATPEPTLGPVGPIDFPSRWLTIQLLDDRMLVYPSRILYLNTILATAATDLLPCIMGRMHPRSGRYAPVGLLTLKS